MAVADLASKKRRPRAYQRIVEEIRDDIFRRRVAPGDRLPNEPELAEHFDVSRLAVREALRVLELQGLVRVEHGFQGGAFVADGGVGPVRDALETMLRLEHLERAEIYAARRYLEPGVAELAARALDEEIATKLAANLADATRAIDARRPAFQINLDFHFLVASACPNAILTLMTDAVLELLRRAESRRPSDERVNREAAKAHATIYRALRDEDADRAAMAMEVHLQWLAHYYGAQTRRVRRA
jgi:GntR family transcriptional regulator, transcriptional repressor for pyruvate dehydrogenase complex